MSKDELNFDDFDDFENFDTSDMYAGGEDQEPDNQQYDYDEDEDEPEEAKPRWNKNKKEKKPPREKKQKPVKEKTRSKSEKQSKKVTRKKPAFGKNIIVGGGVVLASLLIYFVIQPLMSGVIGQQIKVPVVSETIYAGEVITSSQITWEERSRGSIPAGALRTEEEIVDKLTDSKLVEGDYFMDEKIKSSEYGNDLDMNGMDGTDRYISVAIPNFAQGLSAKLKKNDIVTIVTAPSDNSTNTQTYPDLQYVKVTDVTLPSGGDASEDSGEDDELPTAVTLLVNEQQAELLAALNATGRIHFILTYRGTEETAEQFLTEQDNYFASGQLQ